MKTKSFYPYDSFSGMCYHDIDGERILVESARKKVLEYITTKAIPKLLDIIRRERERSTRISSEIEKYKDGGYMEKIMEKKLTKLTMKLDNQNDYIIRLEEELAKLKEASTIKTYEGFLELPCFRP